MAIGEGYRESKESWPGVLRDLKDRGMNVPALAIGDGTLGFWAALKELFPLTTQQLCWLHKMRNILDKLPKKEHPEAVQRLRAIQHASGRGARTCCRPEEFATLLIIARNASVRPM